jgi:dodecin
MFGRSSPPLTTLARQPAYDASAARRAAPPDQPAPKENSMAKKKGGEGVYRVIDVIGSSKDSWEDATKAAVATASKSLRDLRIAEVTQMDVKVENGKVTAYRVRLQLSFKYED